MPVLPGRTFHRLTEATTSGAPSLLGAKPAPVDDCVSTREDVYTSDGYANVFAIHNVLNARECAALVTAGEGFGFEDLKGEYPSSYRANDRVLLHDPVRVTG